MTYKQNFKKLSFLVYGLGLTGRSIVNFFKKNKIKNFLVWDDKNFDLYKNKRPKYLIKALREVDYIVLSPGVSLRISKNKKLLNQFKKKIITDLDLIFLQKMHYKSIVVTGTNGKSTTCKILSHVLKKNGYNILLGGNIGIPVLKLKIKKKTILVIEASSFQLAHSKFICPDYAILLNISNDHLDWHGNKRNYVNSKFKIFKNQRTHQYSFLNEKLKSVFKKKKYLGKMIIPNYRIYKGFKHKIENSYLTSDINDENMSYVFKLAKIMKISEKSFLNSLKTFVGLPHRYEIFLKKKNCVFINDSKATSFEASRFALKNTKNVYWIVGGLPKKNDIFKFNDLKKNIIKSYIIGENLNFFRKQIKNKINYSIALDLNRSLIQILRDIKTSKNKKNSILLSPAAASFDQFLNFEKRGDEFKKLSRYYARKYL